MESIKSNLAATVKHLSHDIGQRSYLDVERLNRTADYIEGKFRSYGCNVKRQPFNYRGNIYYNPNPAINNLFYHKRQAGVAERPFICDTLKPNHPII